MENDKQRYYDEIVSTIIQNVLAEHQRNGYFVINNFNPSFAADKLYFEASLIASEFCNNEPIYIHAPFLSYWHFKLTHWKLRKIIKYTGKLYGITSVSVIMEHVRKYYDLDWSVFSDIVKEFYERDEH